MSVAIGIDLGTTYSCVAASAGDNIEVIANAEGERTTPSWVAFTEVHVLVGKHAVEQASLNVKRLMGMKYTDESVRKDRKHWPFRVIETNEGSAAVAVEYQGKAEQYSPEQISAMILGKMKETAEDYLDAKVDKAVITVPAYFNDGQRQATIDAAKIAGLQVLQIINEPTAAALAYGVKLSCDEPRNVLVFDFGGGTLDVTILKISAKQFEVIATDGDSHLGGEDFVTALMDHCIDEFEKVNKVTVERTSDMLQELREECEKAKKTLSTENLEQILLRGFFNDIDLNVHVYRSKFEELCEPLFMRAISLVRQALAAVKMHKNEIDEVLLVGGSTRIPRMQQTLKKFFNGLDLSRTVPPDHAVAYGAAVQAAALSGNKSFGEVSLSDVIPLSLGVENHDGSMGVIVKRNSRIPASATSVYTTVVDKQTTLTYSVYEGEHKLAEKNHFLGSFSLRGIVPAPKGKAKTDVAFTVDANGILSITAVERGTNNKGGMTLAFDKGRLSEVEIQRMIQEAEKLRADERAVIERNRASNKLEHYCTKVQRELKSKTVKKKLNSEEILVIRAKCVQIQAQLAKKRATKEEIEALDQELTDLCGSLSTALSESSSSDESESSSGDEESEAGLKRKAEHDSDRPAKDSNNTAVKIERQNKRTKTDESYKNLSL